ncbi:MAG: flagellar brake protein [Methylococcaceae bacterium]|jgi:c-di-GMP-binding flagellar brake protein YcgR
MNKDDSFYITNSVEIFSHLNFLAKKNCFITANFGEANESFITTIIDINKKTNTLYLDYAPKEYLSQQALNSPKISFRTEYEGIKVLFETTKLAKDKANGNQAFSLAIPKLLFWQERREFHRVKSPLSKDSYCKLSFPGKESVNLQLYDISLTGFAILNKSKQISQLITPPMPFDDCKLSLAETGDGSISFEVRNKVIINPDRVEPIQRIGCRFTKVSVAFEATIQRYIQQLEREYKLKE